MSSIKCAHTYFGDDLNLVADLADPTTKQGAKWLTPVLLVGRDHSMLRRNIRLVAQTLFRVYFFISRSPATLSYGEGFIFVIGSFSTHHSTI